MDALAAVGIAHVLHRVFGHVLGAAVAGYHVTAGRELVSISGGTPFSSGESELRAAIYFFVSGGSQ
jgi:hypothetical protein